MLFFRRIWRGFLLLSRFIEDFRSSLVIPITENSLECASCKSLAQVPLCESCLSLINPAPKLKYASIKSCFLYTGPIKQLILNVKIRDEKASLSAILWLIERDVIPYHSLKCCEAVYSVPLSLRSRLLGKIDIAGAMSGVVGQRIRSKVFTLKTCGWYIKKRSFCKVREFIQWVDPSNHCYMALIVDDVLTTGTTLQRARLGVEKSAICLTLAISPNLAKKWKESGDHSAEIR